MEPRFVDADEAIRQCLRQSQREWWGRYRWAAWILILAVWSHVLALAIAMGWQTLEAFRLVAFSGGG